MVKLTTAGGSRVVELCIGQPDLAAGVVIVEAVPKVGQIGEAHPAAQRGQRIGRKRIQCLAQVLHACVAKSIQLSNQLFALQTQFLLVSSMETIPRPQLTVSHLRSQSAAAAIPR